MNKNRVVKFEPRQHLLERAKKYVETPELIFSGSEKAIPLLLKAVRQAHGELKREIMFVLGTFAKEEVIGPLYEIMTDPAEDENVRHDAAIQISVIGAFLKDPQPLVERLLQEIESPDARRRRYATLAIGWRGHGAAAIPLIERLYDSDVQVQQTAVNALCNLRDDRLFNLLADRLDHAPLEQRHSILFNLWRFDAKKDQVKKIYLRYLEHEHPELRFDALVGIGTVADLRERLAAYRRGLRDEDSRIRELALERLAEEARPESLRAEIEPLLDDPDMDVKKAALRILKKNR